MTWCAKLCMCAGASGSLWFFWHTLKLDFYQYNWNVHPAPNESCLPIPRLSRVEEGNFLRSWIQKVGPPHRFLVDDCLVVAVSSESSPMNAVIYAASISVSNGVAKPLYRVSKINASQGMERTWPTALLLAATGSAWLVFNFPPFPVWRFVYWPGSPIHYRVCHTIQSTPFAAEFKAVLATTQISGLRTESESSSGTKPWNLQTWQQSYPIAISWRQAQCSAGTNPFLPFPLHVWREGCWSSSLLKSQPFYINTRVHIYNCSTIRQWANVDIPCPSMKHPPENEGKINTSQAEPVAANSRAVGQFLSISWKAFCWRTR